MMKFYLYTFQIIQLYISYIFLGKFVFLHKLGKPIFEVVECFLFITYPSVFVGIIIIDLYLLSRPMSNQIGLDLDLL